jgi:hypothetical protein
MQPRRGIYSLVESGRDVMLGRKSCEQASKGSSREMGFARLLESQDNLLTLVSRKSEI